MTLSSRTQFLKNAAVVGVLVLAVTLSGCTNIPIGRDNRFVGSWKGSLQTTYGTVTDSFTCFSDGTLTAGSGLFAGGGRWDIKDGKFVISAQDGTTAGSFSYSFSDDGNSLTLTNTNTGITITYAKQ